jgi:hypothetical protein
MKPFIRSFLIGYALTLVIAVIIIVAYLYITKVFNADNVIGNYERFFDIKREYDTRIAQIKDMKGQLVQFQHNEPELLRINQELSAVRMSCRTLANTYNADSMKITREHFKSDTLPFTLDKETCEQ